ncbi:Uncharacterised protein [Bartonella elizabethae]|nr:Uncharacterised protein [Bartonella elizabethae]
MGILDHNLENNWNPPKPYLTTQNARNLYPLAPLFFFIANLRRWREDISSRKPTIKINGAAAGISKKDKQILGILDHNLENNWNPPKPYLTTQNARNLYPLAPLFFFIANLRRWREDISSRKPTIKINGAAAG